jgi:hypothetical protein
MTATKKTSAAVAKIAGRVLSDADAGVAPFAADIGSAVDASLKDCGLPMNPAAVNRLVDRIGEALAPLFVDLRTLAASALGQTEPGDPVEPKSDFDAGDEELEGN